METSFRPENGDRYNIDIGENFQASIDVEFSSEEEDLFADLLSEAELINSVEQEKIPSLLPDCNCSLTVSPDSKIGNEEFQFLETIAGSSEEIYQSSEKLILADVKIEQDESVIQLDASVAKVEIPIQEDFTPKNENLLIFNVFEDGRVEFKFLKNLDFSSAKKHDNRGGEYAVISGNSLLARRGCGLKEGEKHKISGKELTVVFMSTQQEEVLKRFVARFISEMKENEKEDVDKSKKISSHQTNQPLLKDNPNKPKVQHKVSNISEQVTGLQDVYRKERQNYKNYLIYADKVDLLKSIILKHRIKNESISFSEAKQSQLNNSIDEQEIRQVNHKVFNLTTLTLKDFKSKNGSLRYESV